MADAKPKKPKPLTVAEDRVLAALRQQAAAGLPCPTNATFQRVLAVNSRSTVPNILARLEDLGLIRLEMAGERRRVWVRAAADGQEQPTGWGAYRITGTASAFRRQHTALDGFGDTAIEPDKTKSVDQATRMPSVAEALHNRKKIDDAHLAACSMFEAFYAKANLDPLRAQRLESGGGGGATSFDGVPASVSNARARVRRCLDQCFPADANGQIDASTMEMRRAAEMLIGRGMSIKAFCEESAAITGRPMRRPRAMKIIDKVVHELTRFYGTAIDPNETVQQRRRRR